MTVHLRSLFASLFLPPWGPSKTAPPYFTTKHILRHDWGRKRCSQRKEGLRSVEGVGSPTLVVNINKEGLPTVRSRVGCRVDFRGPAQQWVRTRGVVPLAGLTASAVGGQEKQHFCCSCVQARRARRAPGLHGMRLSPARAARLPLCTLLTCALRELWRARGLPDFWSLFGHVALTSVM